MNVEAAYEAELVGRKQTAFWRKVDAAREFVYFVQGEPGNPIKIGYTKDIDSRLAGLQTGCWERLRVLALIPGSPALEAAFHRLLRKDRREGEWFDGVVVHEALEEVVTASITMMRIWEEKGWLADPFDHLNMVTRPVVTLAAPARHQNPPVSHGRKARVAGPYTGTGMHRSWRMSQVKDAPVTVRVVDPATMDRTPSRLRSQDRPRPLRVPPEGLRKAA